eukprot:4407850-Heterocapsa_arctica.AAC.1
MPSPGGRPSPTCRPCSSDEDGEGVDGDGSAGSVGERNARTEVPMGQNFSTAEDWRGCRRRG